MTERFEEDDHVTVEGYRGVAWVVIGPGQVWEPTEFLVFDDDTGAEWWEIDHSEGEWVDDPNGETLRCVMVGDDRVHTFETHELTRLEEGDYCPSCGQIGCDAHALG